MSSFEEGEIKLSHCPEEPKEVKWQKAPRWGSGRARIVMGLPGIYLFLRAKSAWHLSRRTVAGHYIAGRRSSPRP